MKLIQPATEADPELMFFRWIVEFLTIALVGGVLSSLATSVPLEIGPSFLLLALISVGLNIVCVLNLVYVAQVGAH